MGKERQNKVHQKSSVVKTQKIATVGKKIKNPIEGKFKKILGTGSEELGFLFVCQAMGAMGFIKDKDSNSEKLKQVMALVFQAIQGIGPKNELEAMLSVQITSTHNMSAEFARRAMHPQQSAEGVDNNINRAVKLMELFINQVACLQKLRGLGPQQTVRVEHINIHPGAQAVLGVVNPNRGEGEGEDDNK